MGTKEFQFLYKTGERSFAINAGNKQTIFTLNKKFQERQSYIYLHFHFKLQRWMRGVELCVKSRDVVDKTGNRKCIINLTQIHIGYTPPPKKISHKNSQKMLHRTGIRGLHITRYPNFDE